MEEAKQKVDAVEKLGNDVMRKLMVHLMHLLQGAVISALMRLRCSPQL